MALPSSSGAKLRASTISAGRSETGNGYVGCDGFAMLLSFVSFAFVSSIRDRLGGGGLKKLSSVRGRFAVAMFRFGSRLGIETG
jgi:hypothetical protein